MIFSDPVFIFLFLPLTWLGWVAAGLLNRGNRASLAWIVAASVVFYGWWHVDNVAVILGSVFFNFVLAQGMARAQRLGVRRALLTMAIASNLGLLVTFKYVHFLFGLKLGLILPLAISFFTFQQISYMVDVYRGMEPETSLLRFTFYVTFFPQLIAGPILNFKDLRPQLSGCAWHKLQAADFVSGFTRFVTGLGKKLLIADALAPFVDAAFALPAEGGELGTALAWAAGLGFYFQIFFDFSGYSDMALGLALMFGVSLPENFRDPYRATSLVDFWRRWHISLSVFLRDYLYITLGGNRHGALRQTSAILCTMLLGGLWHGASWNFIAWGALHGLGLVLNHAWRRSSLVRASTWPVGFMLTQFFVFLCWIPFRAESLADAGAILAAMVPAGDVQWPQLLEAAAVTRLPIPLSYLGLFDAAAMSAEYWGVILAAAAVFIWRPAGTLRFAWNRWGAGISANQGWSPWRSLGYLTLQAVVFLALAARIVQASVVQPFIYFQF